MAFLQRHTWLPFVLALALGLITPGAADGGSTLIVPLMMGALFLACLKVDAIDVLSHLRKPGFMTWIVIGLMLIIPALAYGLMSFVNSDLALAVLLLAAMPPATAAPAITDALGGRASLSLAVSFVALIVSPLTLLLLFATFTGSTVHFDLRNLFITLVVVNLTPLLAAQLARRTMPGVLERTQQHHGVVSLLLISVVIYLAVASAADDIISRPLDALVNTGWLYAVFVLLLGAGYLLGLRKNKPDRIALAVSSGFMNNALAIGLAASLFGPQIAFIVVLSEIPWSTMMGPLQLALRKLV